MLALLIMILVTSRREWDRDRIYSFKFLSAAENILDPWLTPNLLWMKEIQHQLVDGLSRYPIIYSIP